MIVNQIYQDVNTYYSNKVNKFGATPKGVDWNGAESQILRFTQLLKIIDHNEFSLTDIGCGYGRLYEYMDEKYDSFEYYGYDISEDMIQKAKETYTGNTNKTFLHISSVNDIKISDYLVASGIFNVKMNYSDTQWLDYILETLDVLNSKCLHGFSFNILTSYSDKEYMKDTLYYADPLFLFDYCKKHFSQNVALLHDYDLYEFTILVKKAA
ncbi:class I SAM-dependent methyltransferase [bacterium]|nr:class I SAM-dependent methyltransferase [bacterium]MBU1990596.1 class I SAM-dependent methyltransferase [bacterium]